MKSKKVLLALNPKLYELVKQKAEQRYMGVQDLIYNILRENVLQPKKKSKAGRPPKVDEPYLEYFSRKR